MKFPSGKTILFVVVMGFLIWFVVKSPGHADHLAHSLGHGVGHAAESFSRFLSGL